MKSQVRGLKIRWGLLLPVWAVGFAICASWVFAQDAAPAKTEGSKADSSPAVSYAAEKLRDPFMSSIQSEMLNTAVVDVPVAIDVPLPEMKVQGIFWGGKFPQAIINDKIVKVGETIDGARVVSIEKDLVRVFYVSKEFSLASPASQNLASSSNKNEVKKEATNE